MSDTATTLAVVKAARSLIAEKGWARGFLATDAQGNPCYVSAPEAACFCMSGALARAGLDLAGTRPSERSAVFDAEFQARIALRRIVQRRHEALTLDLAAIPTFNDSDATSREDVLSVFDEAIENLETANV